MKKNSNRMNISHKIKHLTMMINFIQSDHPHTCCTSLPGSEFHAGGDDSDMFRNNLNPQATDIAVGSAV